MELNTVSFSVVTRLPHSENRQRAHAYLVEDNWDDWSKFRTMFSLYVVDSQGITHEPGSVKIGEVDLKPSRERTAGFRSPTLDRSFAALGEQHFSIGQSENYYETLNELDPEFKEMILVGLRDCAFDLSIFDHNHEQVVMSESLLRDVRERNVKNRFHRLAHGNAELTRFEFEFEFPSIPENSDSPPVLNFEVIPESVPPTNVHVVIGRNGVGKTRCMQNLSRAVLGVNNQHNMHGELRRLGSNADEWTFSGIVSVSFSSFDDFDLPRSAEGELKANQVGLRARTETGQADDAHIKTPAMLASDFSESLSRCKTGLRGRRWKESVSMLEADPLFAEANVTQLLDYEEEVWNEQVQRHFKRLSSGHAIVLLTITRLVELVDERTLVILDEPEGHLHPPLLAAFVRALSGLLIRRNGVALIATHSPVVLQEVPQCCVWKLRRSGATSVVQRPEIETFGENVGILTREVFGLEVTNSGFHNLLKMVVSRGGSYDECFQAFEGQLGLEAQAILMGLVFSRDQGRGDVDEDLA
ncbi:MAG: AAA family ATPase [Fluviicoccus sp.]|uniref:AAA family ATPase n=1 Tax=Fluviicoccus sp. TaxID=2003552 RepID=UPI00271D0E50|nr:AAA family ATPase [Fluviicoccus sp.]MDO8330313.1 AAA family ATPase [Fluviicoccus sp.]